MGLKIQVVQNSRVGYLVLKLRGHANTSHFFFSTLHTLPGIVGAVPAKPVTQISRNVG